MRRIKDRRIKKFVLKSKKHGRKLSMILLLLAVLTISAMLVMASARAEGTATISTDKADYSPGETVTIYGSVFAANASVTLTVTRPDNSTNTWSVTSDSSGAFTTTYELDGITGTYQASATDGTNTATTTFTDTESAQMTVSYDIIGDGSGYSPPIFRYVNPDGIGVQYTLTMPATDIDVKPYSSWSVTPNPLTGSTTSERWYSSQELDGTALGSGHHEYKDFTFYHQYKVSFAVSPGLAGSTTPFGNVWENAGSLSISATAKSGYVFDHWLSSTESITFASSSSASTTATISGTGTITANFLLSDTTPPMVTIIFPDPDGSNGWFKSSPVTGTLTITDPSNVAFVSITGASVSGESGLGTTTYVATLTVSGDDMHSVSVTATDGVGNSGAALGSTNTATIKIDTTPPTVILTPDRDPDHNGWYNHAVIWTVSGTDATSGVASTDPAITYSGPDSATASVTASATDQAGNVGTVSASFQYDATPPTVTGASTTSPNANGWYNTNVVIHFEATDSLSGIDSVTPDTTLSAEATGQSATGTATDKAGNSASTTVSGINIDKTPPTITGSRSPDANANGWNNVEVTVSFTVDDALSGVDPTTIPSAVVLSTEGAGQSATAIVYDKAGNSASATVKDINIDKTAPVVKITGPTEGGFYKTSTLPALIFSVTETNSYTEVVSGWATTEGVHTVTVTATDAADNVGTACVTYTVDNTAPVVTIIAPADGGHYNVGTVPSLDYTVLESSPYATSERGYLTTLGVHTVTVTATDAAGNVGSASATYTVGQTTLTYTGATAGQYSDPATVSAKLTEVATGTPLSGKTITFAIGTQTATATTDASGVATASITLTQPSGSYTVSASFAGDSNYQPSTDSKPFTINTEIVTITYTGDTLVFTAGPKITTAPVHLSAHLDQEADGYPGDLTLATVTFQLFKCTNLMTTPDLTFNVPVSTSGDALTTATLPVDVWTVKITVQSGNKYWTQSSEGIGVLTIAPGSAKQSVFGGGWIHDSMSANGKAYFCFMVNYVKNAVPTGCFIYYYRGTDGYDYIIKSTSWQGGGLSFTGTNKAYFTGKCSILIINRATGKLVGCKGNYKFAVDITDGDLSTPRTTDTIAITIFDSSGAIWRQIGTPTAEIPLGGGNIVIYSK
jgi:hypothetical protein